MRFRWFVYRFLALVALATLALTACSGAPPPTAAPAAAVTLTDTKMPTTEPTETPAPTATLASTATAAPTATKAPVGEGELKVIAPAITFEKGSFSWTAAFTADTGCKVTIDDFVDYDSTLPLLKSGGYDVIMAGASSMRLVSAGLVQEIDIGRVPSWETVDARLRNATWNSVSGKYYGVPYLWYPNILMYNTDVFSTPPASWDVVFIEQSLPDGKSNNGRVQAPYSAVYIAEAALYLMAHKPELGITDPFKLNEKQLAEAIVLLRGQKKILGGYYSSYEKQIADFANKGYAASSTRPIALLQLIDTFKKPIAGTIPQEGATGVAYTSMLTSNAPHPNCAYMWFERSISPRVQGYAAGYLSFSPAVPSICEDSTRTMSVKYCERSGLEALDRIHFMQTPILDCGNGQNNCTTEARWVKEYQALVQP